MTISEIPTNKLITITVKYIFALNTALSVIAVENCKTLCIDGESFKSLCDRIPLLGYRVIYKIAKRIALSLRKSNRDFMVLYEALLDEVHGE